MPTKANYDSDENDFVDRVMSGNIVAKIIGGIVGIIALFVFFSSWYTVEQGERAVLLRVGAVEGVSGPGLHFKTPWLESIERIDVRTTWVAWEHTGAMEAYSKDQQPAHLAVKVTYHVLSDDKSIIALYSQYRNRESFADSVLIPRVLEGVKTTFGQYNAVTAIQSRAKFNSDVEATVRALVQGPIVIEGVQIQDIAFSDAYEKAVELRMTAQVEVDRLSMNLERERKQAEIKVVQANAEQSRLEAIGKGQAAAINLRGEALRNNPQLVELTVAERWDGKLPTTMVPGGSVPLVNIK